MLGFFPPLKIVMLEVTGLVSNTSVPLLRNDSLADKSISPCPKLNYFYVPCKKMKRGAVGR